MPKNSSSVRNGYLLSVKKHLAKALTVDEVTAVESELSRTGNQQEMKSIYKRYSDLAKSRNRSVPTEEEIQFEEEVQQPLIPHNLDRKATTAQTFARAKLSENIVKQKYIHWPENRTLKPTPTYDRSNRFQLSFETWSHYQKRRRDELVQMWRKYPFSTNNKQTMKLLVENQTIERYQILENFEAGLEVIKVKHARNLRIIKKRQYKDEVIPIETLRVLEEKEFYDREYLLKTYQFQDLMNKLGEKQNEFLVHFFQFIELQEHALNQYKNETNELYIQFGFATNATYQKEQAQKEKRIREEPLERQALEQEENMMRKAIEQEQDRLDEINKQFTNLMKKVQRQTTEEKRQVLEQQLMKKEQEQREIQQKIERQISELHLLENRNRDDIERELGVIQGDIYII